MIDDSTVSISNCLGWWFPKLITLIVMSFDHHIDVMSNPSSLTTLSQQRQHLTVPGTRIFKLCDIQNGGTTSKNRLQGHPLVLWVFVVPVGGTTSSLKTTGLGQCLVMPSTN